MKIDNIDNQALVTLNDAGMTFNEIGYRFGMTRGKVAGIVRRTKEADKRRKFFETVQLGSPLHLRGDFVVVGDVHVPCTDYGFAGMVLVVAKKHGIKRLIIAGDMFNMDTFGFYDAVVNQPSWKDERDAARVLFRDWLEWFDEIYVLMGNHDRRLQKWTAGQLDESDIFGMITSSDKVRVSNYGYLTVDTWRITHPKNYSIDFLKVADTLASKYQSNILSFHEHHLGITRDRYNNYTIANGGCLVDPAKLAYVALDDSKSAGMVQGFAMLRNGYVTVFGKSEFTDWSEYA